MRAAGASFRLADDRHKLVMDHLGLAVAYGKSMARGRLKPDELHGAARLGAVEAGARFEPERGLLFKTFLRHYVHKYVTVAIYGSAAVHIPVNFFSEDRRRTEGLPPEWVARREAALAAAERGWRALSLDAPDPRTGRSRAGSVPCRAGTDAADPDDLESLRVHLGRLIPRDRDVLERYYGRGETMVAIAADYGITKQRVGQIKDAALAELREMFEVPTHEGKPR